MSRFNIIYKFLKLHLNEKRSRKSIQKIQDRKLHKLLRYAFDNSAYYRELFEKSGITVENLENVQLSQIPITNKNQLMSNFNSLVTVKGITQEKLRNFDENSAVNRETMNGYHVIHQEVRVRHTIFSMTVRLGTQCLQELFVVHCGECH